MSRNVGLAARVRALLNDATDPWVEPTRQYRRPILAAWWVAVLLMALATAAAAVRAPLLCLLFGPWLAVQFACTVVLEERTRPDSRAS